MTTPPMPAEPRQHRPGLLPAAALAAAAAVFIAASLRAEPPSAADFRPSRHGFGFPNSFSGVPMPAALRALTGGTLDSGRFGLCGGMSFCAADDYLAGRPSPPGATPPRAGTPLYERIYARQVDSLGPGMGMVRTFLSWMRAPDDGPAGVRVATVAAIAPALERMGRGEFAVIGMVLVRAGRGVIWNNHQVLAWAAERPARGEIALRIYDPNHPRNDRVTLHLTLTVSGMWPTPGPAPVPAAAAVSRLVVEPLPGSPGTTRRQPVRGLFEMPYRPGG